MVIPLSSTTAQQSTPTVVLIHGLDANKGTWHGILHDLHSASYPAIAFDLRGHGDSPLGDPAEFSAAAVAEDVVAAIQACGSRLPAVLVGHSMGGRVAARVAAVDAQRSRAGARPLLAACVIVDMDLRVRHPPWSADADLSEPQLAALGSFASENGQRFGSWEEARDALLPWYAEDPGSGSDQWVDSWKGKQVRPAPSGGWWSDLNPLGRRLAFRSLLETADGLDAWDVLARERPLRFEVHVWRAERQSGCRDEGEGGLLDMRARLPELHVRVFGGSAHSIHWSNREEFAAALRGVVDGAASRLRAGS
ncbi:unnamed protein product [Prorocentrum cordatum]|uniref:AB hydrolase-1 domain-containing protein n=1 Tax=Prorocentrum cordatum TaxID=2364126 RepID=A0ABN9QWB7_9DINO|nr:unnamed protein product [Polarella glacialis]